MQLGENDILVLEGIHGLNEKMSYALPEESKYKIYISALTTLNVDGHNRIPTTDGRLLRRMVRDGGQAPREPSRCGTPCAEGRRKISSRSRRRLTPCSIRP